MEILSTSGKDLERAAAVLAAGGIVAFPTETVYGLGGDAFNPGALARIFEAKRRPFFDPLIVHIAERDAVSRAADISAMSAAAREKLTALSERLWPGPLTLILPKREEIPELASGGLRTIALRFPRHPVARELIRLSTGAIAAPSANSFGGLSPTRAAHVEAQLGGKVDLIVDGGRTEVGLESTVLDLTRDSPRILRHGGTSREAIEAVIGPVELAAFEPSPQMVVSPGQLKSHYAPKTPLALCRAGELEAVPGNPDEGRLYFSAPRSGKNMPAERTRVLSETGNLTEAAANFFDMLHELDGLGLALIRAEEAPSYGLGEAINDRLRRAASV